MRTNVKRSGIRQKLGSALTSAGMALTVLCFLATGTAVSAKDCNLKQIAWLDMEVTDYRLLIPMTLAGRPVHLLVDTGGAWSMLNRDVADELGLKPKRLWDGYFVDGAGHKLDQYVHVPGYQIGILKSDKPFDFIVGLTDEKTGAAIEEDGSLGANFLKSFDIELNISAGKFGLYLQDHCEGQVVYWTKDVYGVVPLRKVQDTLIEADIVLDGQKLDALIDSGSPETTLSLSLAKKKFNLQPGSPGVEFLGSIRMASGASMEAYRYTFKSLKFGEVIFYDVPMVLAPIKGDDMILGLNELKLMHVYLAYSEMKMYVTPVEAASPGRVKKDAPADSLDAILTRGAALADEGKAHEALHEFDRAVQEYPKRAEGYVARASIYLLLGDYGQSATNLTEAIRIRPDEGGFYFQRGVLYVAAGQYEKAIVDFEKATDLAPSLPYPPILRHVTLLKMGKSGAQDLKRFAKRIAGGAWPAPVFDLFLGKATAETVRTKAAQGAVKDHVSGQKCEAAFYIGEFELSSGQADAAKKQFEEAVEICPKAYVEYLLARAELKLPPEGIR